MLNDPQTGMTPKFLSPMNRISIPLPALLVVALLFAGCSGASDSDTPESADTPSQQASAQETGASNGSPGTGRTVRVGTRVMQPSTFEEIIPITGSVTAPEDASLSAQSAGTLTQLAEVGTRVGEGDVVARLDDRLVRAALDQAKANLVSVESQAQLAEETWRRQEPLYSDSIISALEFESVTTQRNQARAALAQAEAAVAQAEQQYENTFIRAPFPGTVEERFANPGEQVMPGAPVARVVNTRNLKVVAGVPETYAADIRPGTKVLLSFRAYSDDTREETVSFVGSVINPQSRTFSIEVAISNAGGILKPAMIADLKVTRRVLENQMVIPQTSILRDENGTSVYVAVEDGGQLVADRKPIRLGPSYAGMTVVADGLVSGDEVIVTGQTSVTEGDIVLVANQQGAN